MANPKNPSRNQAPTTGDEDSPPKPRAIFAVMTKDLRMRVPDSLIELLGIKPGDAIMFEVHESGSRIEVKNPSHRLYESELVE